MNKKILSIICLLLLNVVIAVPHAHAARKVLSVPVYSQIDDFSCWAACCKSIIQFCEGSSPSQQTIINYIPGGDNGASLDESKQALAHWNVISSKKSSALTYSGVDRRLTIIIRFGLDFHEVAGGLDNTQMLLGVMTRVLILSCI